MQKLVSIKSEQLTRTFEVLVRRKLFSCIDLFNSRNSFSLLLILLAWASHAPDY